MTDPAAPITAAPYTTLPDIIDTLTRARENAGLGQRAAADLIGIPQSTLAAWETTRSDRRQTPGADRLIAWANAYGLDLWIAAPAAEADAYRRGLCDGAAAITEAAIDALRAITRPTTQTGT